ncbi:MAG TPA: TonB family protein [Roseiarcus sp.]|nr:TonB family protein [Roseiarcus sp.]
MAAPDSAFRANPDERLLQPQTFEKGRGRFVAPLGACLIYALLIGPVLLEDLLHPEAPAAIQEIPVEIVVEQPEQKPPEPPAKSPPAKPLDEQPAFDAPRLANNAKQETLSPDEPAKSPPAPEEAKPPSPKPEPSKTPDAAKEDAPQKEQAAPLASDAEASPQGEAPPPQKQPSEEHAEAEAPKDTASDAARFPTFESVPDIDFGALAKPAPIAGGKAKATYLSIIYGMIMARIHFPENATRPAGSKLEGTIVFSVDAMGGLIQRSIVHPSGSHALDRAAYEAVGRAAPFPRPPNGAPIGLRFTYGAN